MEQLTDTGLTIRRVPLTELHADPANARAHDEVNLAAIEGSLARFQQVEPLVVQAGTRRVIGGNYPDTGGRHVMALARWTDRALEELSHQDVARFLVAQQDGRSAATLNSLRSSLRCFFAWAEAAGYLERNPARFVQRARTCPPPPRGLSDAEQERLVAALDAARTWEERRDRALFLTMLWTGIRLGSALALRVDDLDLDAAVIAIRGKGGLRARLPIAVRVVELLGEWMQEEGAVFPSRSGGALSARQAQARLASWRKRAGIRGVNPHALRHSFAQGLLRRTGNLAVVQRALTHRSIRSTEVYARADDAALRAALGAL